MNDGALAFVALFAASAPLAGLGAFAASAGGGGAAAWRAALLAAAMSFALFALALALGDDVLDALDISPDSFRIAAGILMMPRATRLLRTGDTMALPAAPAASVWRAALVPGAIPLLIAPSSLAVAVAHLDRAGAGMTLAAAATIAVIAAAAFAFAPRLVRSPGPSWLGAGGRATGVLLVIVAVEMIESGVRGV